MKLHRDLGVTQKTAWHLGRSSWNESYFGGKEQNKHASKREHRGRGTVGKTAVAGAKDRETNQISAALLGAISRCAFQPAQRAGPVGLRRARATGRRASVGQPIRVSRGRVGRRLPRGTAQRHQMPAAAHGAQRLGNGRGPAPAGDRAPGRNRGASGHGSVRGAFLGARYGARGRPAPPHARFSRRSGRDGLRSGRIGRFRRRHRGRGGPSCAVGGRSWRGLDVVGCQAGQFGGRLTATLGG